MVGEHVTGANDHLQASPAANWYDPQQSLAQEIPACKEKYLFIGILILKIKNNSCVHSRKSN
jgi:hypothetical protein